MILENSQCIEIILSKLYRIIINSEYYEKIIQNMSPKIITRTNLYVKLTFTV